jgi:hypothetical protein
MDRPTITPGPGGHNDSAVPTRADLARARPLHPGRAAKADLLTLDLGQGPMVIKDFGRKRWWVRLIGRLQIGREFRAYRWLGPTPGVPRLIGRIDAHALAIEQIDGKQLGLSPERRALGPRLFPRLREILDRIHATGMVHWDLRTRDNVLYTQDEEVYILDLASAVWMRPGSLAHRLFFARMKLIDDSALLKWKKILGAGEPTAREREFLRRYERWRGLWPFNPKRRKSR